MIVGILTQLFILITPFVDSNFNYIILAPYFLIPAGALMVVLGWHDKRKPTGSLWGMKQERKNAES